MDSYSESHRTGGLRMFELFLKELHGYARKLNDEIKRLNSSEYDKEPLEQALNIVRGIKSDAAITQLEGIEKLGGALEIFFVEALERKTPLDQEKIGLVVRITELLFEIAKLLPGQLLSQLKLYEKNIEDLQEAVTNHLTKKTLKRGYHIADKGMLELLDRSALKEFMQVVQVESRFLNEKLASLESLKPTPEEVDRLLDSARRISKAARQVQMPELMRLGNLLETLFERFRENKFKFDDKKLDILFSSLDLLNKIAAVNPQDFSQGIKENENHIASVIVDLSVLANTKSASEPVEKEGEALVDEVMLDLFRVELESQTKALNEGILALERSPQSKEPFESLMRAAHSIKGAAKVIGLDLLSSLAHTLEDFFLSLKEGHLLLGTVESDLLLRTTDFFSLVSKVPLVGMTSWLSSQKIKIEKLQVELSSFAKSEKPKLPIAAAPPKNSVEPIQKEPPKNTSPEDSEYEGVVRVSAQNLNRLIGLAGESMVETRWLQPFGESLNKIKKMHGDLTGELDLLRDSLVKAISPDTEQFFVNLVHKTNQSRQSLNDRLSELDLFISRHSFLSDRLYNEVIRSRMRPFSDGVGAFARLVRDLARQVKKNVKLEILGKSTLVDRDILEKLESPLSHLIRNAIDHGIELPDERLAKGKPAQGTIRLEAEHRAGMLLITVTDDGEGLDSELLREKIIEKNLVSRAMASKLTQKELIEFLFLPGFSTAKEVTELSGRGIGLDVVRNVVREVSGAVRFEFWKGEGVKVTLQLPLTLSVLRSLIVEIGDEPYAFPLSRMERFIKIERSSIEIIENRQFFKFSGQNIGLIDAAQILELPPSKSPSSFVNVIIIESHEAKYGIVVDRFIGERELVIQEIDPMIGKIPNISSGALMEDGSPVLIIDVEDLINSLDALLTGGRVLHVGYSKNDTSKMLKKRVLVVDDSITVREVESRLLRNHGYVVETAVNGTDGWNAVRMNQYDLVITDIDMPRMNGIELVRLIRSDSRLKTLPVIIVSYKENENDRLEGMEAGANYYVTKSSFHDDTLLNIVSDLVGN